MTPVVERGAFVQALRDYAGRAHDNYSGRVVVPEVILSDAAACIEDQRAELDRQTTPAAPDAGLRALSEAATPGPWRALSRDVMTDNADWHKDEGAGLGWEIDGPPEPTLRGQFMRGADAHLIVAAVNYVRAALSSPETTPAGVLDPDVERLRRQNHEHAERRDREMAELRRQVDRYQNAYRRAKELVRGSPVDWSKDPKSQEPNGWWEYTSQANREVLMAAVLSSPAGVLDEAALAAIPMPDWHDKPSYVHGWDTAMAAVRAALGRSGSGGGRG